MMRYFVIACFVMLVATPPSKASEQTCLSLDGPADFEFDISDVDNFFNCIELVSYSPAEQLKISTISNGMAHNIKVYSENGNLEDRLQVGIQDFDKAVFTSFPKNSTKLVRLIPVTSGVKKVTVRVSHFTEVDGTQVLIISSQLQALETDPSGPPPPPPPPPPPCFPGEVCYDPLSGPSFYTQTMSVCNSENTPPTQAEMGLDDDEGLNQYLQHLHEVGQDSGLMEALRYLNTHFSDPAQNPKALPGGTEYGGNFRYGAGAGALLEAAGYGQNVHKYITYAGSAYQGAKADLEEIIPPNDYSIFDWPRELLTLELSVAAGLVHIENQGDQDSIKEGIDYYQDVYKNDPNRNSVKDSCSRESAPQDPGPSAGGGGSGGSPFFRPSVIGGTILFPLFGTICDPDDDCYHDSEK